MAHRLGAQNVVSVEIDPGIAEQARTDLAKLGHRLTVVTADGGNGYPAGALYDRIIATYSSADLDPHEVLGNRAALAPALYMGNCRAVFETDPATGGEILWLLGADAWASVLDGQVRQAGIRKLWDEAVTAHQWWLSHDRPDRQQFGLTITPHRQWIWLNDPAHTVTTLIGQR